MKKNLLFTTLMLLFGGIFAQEVTTLTFTAKQQNQAYQPLDSVVVTNLTREWTEVLYFPDTLLLMNTVGITNYESDNGKVKLYQNIPNPFHGVTDFNLTLTNKEKVDLVIFDINGRKVAEYHNTLASGEHLFRATMNTPQTYLLSAITKNGNTSIKMINLSNTGEQARIEHISSQPLAMDMTKKQSQNIFGAGDNMQYVGYATQNDGSHDNTITQTQQGSETITFTFPTEVFDPIVNVTTDSVGKVAITTATLYGHYNVVYTTVTEAGFEWKKSTDTVYEAIYSAKTVTPFSCELKSLEPNTEYTFRAFVKTEADSAYVYGETINFTTEKVKETKVITGEATDINKRGATLHGSYELGNEKLMLIGFELKNKKDSVFDAIYSSTTCISPFQYVYADKLEPSTDYIYRAFVLTVGGTSIYGDEVSFTTAKATPELPVVETGTAETKKYDNTKALLTGEVISEGYCTMEGHGFYMGTTDNPQKDGKQYVVAGVDKNFKYETDVLEPATKYYYVAYATNEQGTAYGDVLTFETRKVGAVPILAVVDVKPFATSAQISCSVTSPILNFGETEEAIIEKGICFSEKTNPTVSDSVIVAANAKTEDFVATMIDLKGNTTYYVKVYAKVFGKTIYSEQAKVTTISMTKPEVQTTSVDKVGSSSATVTSKLTVIGGSENLTLGVRVFNEDLKFDSIYVSTETISSDSTFATKVSDLQKGIKYSVQAYAKNEVGEALGNTLEFTTTTVSCGDSIEDHEGNRYPTIELGTQCWMAQNLRVKTWPDGTKIADGFGNASAKNATIDGPAYYFEMNKKGKITDERAGCHYNFAAFMAGAKPSDSIPSGVRGICPKGWHIPSGPEVKQLREYLLTTAYNYKYGSYTDVYNSIIMPGSFSIEPQKPCGFNLVGTGYYSFSKASQKEENTSSQFVSCSKSPTEGNYLYVYCRPEHYQLAAWIDKKITGDAFAGMTFHEAGAVRCVKDFEK